MQTHNDAKSKPHARIWRNVWGLLWIAASSTNACVSSPAPPITVPCVPPPTVTLCTPPPEPTRLETQADLLRAYIDTLAAWASCAAEVGKVSRYYTLMQSEGGTEQ